MPSAQDKVETIGRIAALLACFSYNFLRSLENRLREELPDGRQLQQDTGPKLAYHGDEPTPA